MKNEPLNSKLPGRYGAMTRTEFDALVAGLDRPIPLSRTQPLSAKERRQWQRAKRRPGRPRNGKGSRVVSLSLEQRLLEETDIAARRTGLSRSALVALGLRTMLDQLKKRAD